MQLIHDVQYRHFESIDSTHLFARNFCAENNACYVFTADEQTGGIGKGSHVWKSPHGNLYASILLPFTGDTSFMSVLTSCVIHELIQKISHGNTKIHWPNDIHINGKKVCGILLEVPNENYLIISVGINTKCIPPDMSDVAGKVDFLDNSELLSRIISGINKWYIESIADKSIIREYCIKNILGLHRRIIVKYNGTQIEGVFKEIDDHFRIVVTCCGGVEKRISTGDMYLSEAQF